MGKIQNYVVIAAFLFAVPTFAQITDRCQNCNMPTKDQLHKASAIEKGTLLNFDAIECLINYTETENTIEIFEKKVIDYNSGEYIDAETAYYLKSKAIPSPMGAFLSAFKNKEEALKMKSENGGEVYNWNEIEDKFKDSDFGVFNHGHHNHNRPDAHAPIGLMGDHLHYKGGFMISVRHMNMRMDGNMNGTSKVNDEDIYKDFMVAPQHMNMQMVMLGLMYAPSDRITVMAMQNYVKNSMGLTAQMMMGGMKNKTDFSTNSTGFGDLRVGALYGLLADNKKSLHINSFINLPVGSVKERDNTPMKDDVKLPYSMQLGSGTFDYSLGVTFKRNFTVGSIGTQVMGTFRTGKNSEGYRFGNQLQINVWGAYALNSNISLSGRVQGITEGKINGNDKELNPETVTTSNTDNYGCKGLKSFVGFNISFSKDSFFNRFRLGAEVGAPFYENYAGIQMNENIHINAGIKYNII